ncbi:MAG: hypothetical protein U0572_05830 [Phycisphaerales bacterium]
MSVRFIQVETKNGETRWINLERVNRVSLATDADGDQILAFMFADGDKVTIHGRDALSQELIRRVLARIESFSAPLPSVAA